MKWFKQTFLAIFCISILISCEYDYIEIVKPPPPPPPCDTCDVDTVFFSTQIEPIFTSSTCTSCHNSSSFLDLTAGNSYASIFANNKVVPGEPENSIIYTEPDPVTGSHYKNYSSSDDSDLIYQWIFQGALDN